MIAGIELLRRRLHCLDRDWSPEPSRRRALGDAGLIGWRFDRRHIASTDWSGYPILRFPAAPESVEVHVLPRPGQPFLGTGEAGQGPMAAAIANALWNATGARVRDLPLSAARVKAAIGV
jgi:CO/xanthine dehydrogenase Mo-binding subunit